MLEQQIQEDIKAAMKAKDTVALAATRAIKGEKTASFMERNRSLF